MNSCQDRIKTEKRSILLICVFIFQITGRIRAEENNRFHIGHKEGIVFINRVAPSTTKRTETSLTFRNHPTADLEESSETSNPSQKQLNHILLSQLRKLGGIKHPRNNTERLFGLAEQLLTNDSIAEELQKLRLLDDLTELTTEPEKSRSTEDPFTISEQTIVLQERRNGKALRKSEINKDKVHIRKKRNWADWIFDDLEILYNCSDPPCPIWSEWRGHGLCDSTCGGGKRLLVRYCDNARYDEPQGGCEGESTRLENCNTHACPVWSAWKPAAKCSSTCGKGTQIFRRSCIKGKSLTHGCVGEKSQYRICDSGLACPAQWSRWSKFGPCSKTCGTKGVQIRKRICVKEGRKVSPNENTCSTGYSAQQRHCLHLAKCEPKYSDWSSWSHCDAVTCGAEGYRSRMRQCLSNSGKPFTQSKMNCKADDLLQREKCYSEPCVKACKVAKAQFAKSQNHYRIPTSTWSQWTEWSRCSVSCGLGGKQSRSRMCFRVHIDDTNHTMIIKENNACEGKPLQIRTCHYNDGCPVWDSWQNWSECTKSCGGRGRMRRERSCLVKLYDRFGAGEEMETHITIKLGGQNSTLNGSVSGQLSTAERQSYPETILFSGGANIYGLQRKLLRSVNVDPEFCQGGTNSTYEYAFCNNHPCLPKWQHWQAWSECSVTCGKGQRQRIRKCNEGTCHGNKIDIAVCVSKPCWTEWSSYSPCTEACGGGVMKRSRKCMGMSKEHSVSLYCSGSENENVPCNQQICPIWGEWGSWSDCSKRCDGGIMSRERKCIQGECVGDTIDTQTCNYQPCPYWTNWSTFSCCSVSCGDGVKVRSRYCRHGHPGDPGCVGNETDTIPCNLNLCDKPTVPPLDPLKCGKKPNSTMKKLILKIFNGKVSASNAWPWQVSWQQRICNGCEWKHLCGATLLGPRWVVTAGHCIEEWKYRVNLEDPGNLWSIVVGMTDLNKPGTRYFVRRVYLHPEYEYRGVMKNDIALLKLRGTVPITDKEMPACLPESHISQLDEECFITGWGNTAPNSVTSPVLREAKIPILDFNICQKIDFFYQRYLSEDQHMCAGDIESTNLSDSCKGDSGGPLVCKKNNGQWYLAGITSFGFYNCGTVGHPGIYAPVLKYEKWIKTTIRTHSHDGC